MSRLNQDGFPTSDATVLHELLNTAITTLVDLTKYHDGDCYCYSQGDTDPEDALRCECHNAKARVTLAALGEPPPPRQEPPRR